MRSRRTPKALTHPKASALGSWGDAVMHLLVRDRKTMRRLRPREQPQSPPEEPRPVEVLSSTDISGEVIKLIDSARQSLVRVKRIFRTLSVPVEVHT